MKRQWLDFGTRIIHQRRRGGGGGGGGGGPIFHVFLFPCFSLGSFFDVFFDSVLFFFLAQRVPCTKKTFKVNFSQTNAKRKHSEPVGYNSNRSSRSNRSNRSNRNSNKNNSNKNNNSNRRNNLVPIVAKISSAFSLVTNDEVPRPNIKGVL